MKKIDSWYFNFRNYITYKYPYCYYFCNNHKHIVKFLFAGIVSGGSDLLLLFFFHGCLNFKIVLATSIAFLLSFMISFSLQKSWTFRNNEKRVGKQLTLYFIVAFINLNLNGFFMHILVNKLKWWYLLSQLVINLSLGLISFMSYKHVIFKEK